jgi:precorrin-6Y C5,15-methyltransferase (decarboxylating)
MATLPGADAWITLVGIGEDGVAGLGDAARAAIAGAVLVVGGERHLQLAAPLIRGQARAWPSPLAEGVKALLAFHSQPVVVLASGDPYCFGIGSTLRRLLPDVPLVCLPAPSSFSLACARLGWALQEAVLASLCGRPLGGLADKLVPGARLLVLSADETTPAQLADHLVAQGFGAATFHLLEALGGPDERWRTTSAAAFAGDPAFAAINRLNLVALELPAQRALPIIELS